MYLDHSDPDDSVTPAVSAGTLDASPADDHLLPNLLGQCTMLDQGLPCFGHLAKNPEFLKVADTQTHVYAKLSTTCAKFWILNVKL